MAVVSRGPMGWLSNRLPAGSVWLFNDVPARRFLAVAWLERGAQPAGPAIRHARHGHLRPGEGLVMAAVMIGADPHKGSHTAVAISPAEESLGELRVRACAGQAEQCWRGRRRGRSGPGRSRALGAWVICWPSSCWQPVSRWWTCSPSSGRGCGCWRPGIRTRTTLTTPGRLLWRRSPPRSDTTRPDAVQHASTAIPCI